MCFFTGGIDKGSLPVEKAAGDRAVADSDRRLGIGDLLPDHREFFFPSGGICADDEEHVGLTGVVMDKDAILFDVIAGSKAGEHLDIAAIARADIDVSNMN